MNQNAETLLDIVLNSLTKSDDISSGSPSAIDEYKCLPIMYPCRSQGASFPATLVNHPACRNLLVVFVHRIVRHSGILSSQRVVLLTRHHRIHKETAGIAQFLRVRKLGATNVDNDLTQLLCGRLADALTLKFATDIAIVKTRLEHRFKLIDNHRDEETVLPVVLEAALAIAILTVLTRNQAQTPCSNLHGMNLSNQVFDLHPVSTNILYSAGSHIARYQGQVLSTIESIAQADIHDVVPSLTASTSHTTSGDIPSLHGRMDHNTREIASKQQIAASSNNDIGLSGLTQQLGYLLGFLSVFVLQETAALGINTKSIMRQQAIIAQIFQPLQQFIRCSA